MSSDVNSIDGQKMHLHPRRLTVWMDAKDDWELAKKVYPIYVEFSPVGTCNHQCTFCSVDYMLDRTDKPRIPYIVMVRTLEAMADKGVKSLLFAGAGEPLLYKDRDSGMTLPDVIRYANSVGLDSEITSNTVLLTEAFAEQLFATPRFRRVRTSLNGGDEETYQKIHRAKPGDFEKVLRNLETAVKIRNKHGSTALITAQMVAVPATKSLPRGKLPIVGNYEDIPSNIYTALALAKRLRNIGVDNFSVKPFKQHTVELEMTRSSAYQDAQYAERNAYLELEKLQTDAFEVTVRHAAMDQQNGEDRGYSTCYSTPFHWAYVEADGEVWGCSAHVGRFEEGKEIGDHRFRFGNINELAFDAIWEGERRKACWEYTRKPACEGGLDVNTCMKGCQMDMPNRFLWRLMNPGPLDNYVK